MGALGGGHCLMMCGGIAHLTGYQGGVRVHFKRIFAYNIGRILGYTLLGAGVGLLSGLFFGSTGNLWKSLLTIFSGLILIVMGIYIGGWNAILIPLERAGAPLWRMVEPLTRRYLPPQNSSQAFALGILWGFLPCGMVYGALLSALTTASVAGGALSMLMFGLGTLPNLILLGWGFGFLSQWRTQRWFRWSSAALLIGWGAFAILRAILLNPTLSALCF